MRGRHQHERSAPGGLQARAHVVRQRPAQPGATPSRARRRSSRPSQPVRSGPDARAHDLVVVDGDDRVAPRCDAAKVNHALRSPQPPRATRSDAGSTCGRGHGTDPSAWRRAYRPEPARLARPPAGPVRRARGPPGHRRLFGVAHRQTRCYHPRVDCQHVKAREVRVAEARASGVRRQSQQPRAADRARLRHPPAALALSETVEGLGFDSVWVGDSLFSKPRYEAISLLSAISQRTSRVKLGTACLVTSPRNPLYLALEWATLDVLAGGRTIFGPCAGNPEVGRPPRVRGAGARLRQAVRDLRGGPRDPADAVDGREDHSPRRAVHVRRRRVLLRHRDGPAHADPEAAALLDRLQSAPVTNAADEKMVRTMKNACRRVLQVRRRLDDLLPGDAPGGARRAARLLPRRGRRDRRRRRAGSSSATR